MTKRLGEESDYPTVEEEEDDDERWMSLKDEDYSPEDFTMAYKAIIKFLGAQEAVLFGELEGWFNFLRSERCEHHIPPNRKWFYMEYPMIFNSLGFSAQTLTRLLKSLEQFGLIYIKSEGYIRKNGGVGRHNLYCLNIEKKREICKEYRISVSKKDKNPQDFLRLMKKAESTITEKAELINNNKERNKNNNVYESSNEDSVNVRKHQPQVGGCLRNPEPRKTLNLPDNQNNNSSDYKKDNSPGQKDIPLDIPKGLLNDNSQQNGYVLPPAVKQIVDHWNGKDALPKLRYPNGAGATKSFVAVQEHITKIVHGKFEHFSNGDQRPYSVKEICNAIDSYYNSFAGKGPVPIWVRNMTLGSFFYNPFGKSCQSHFVKYAHEEINTQGVLPDLLKKEYVKQILRGVARTFTQLEENRFALGAKMLMKAAAVLAPKTFPPPSNSEWAKFTLEALRQCYPDQSIKIGNISSEWTYTEALPRFLEERGILGTDEIVDW